MTEQPLSGLRVIDTRATEKSGPYDTALEDLGADVISVPGLRFADPQERGDIDNAILLLHSFDWIMFASVTGVMRFMYQFKLRKGDARDFAGVKFAVVGQATADVLTKTYGIIPDRVPRRFSADGLLETFGDELQGTRVLLVRGNKGRDTLPRGLQDSGADVLELTVYRSEPDPEAGSALEAISDNGFPIVLSVTSSETLRNVYRAAEEVGRADWLRVLPVASIGAQTTETARELGFNVVTEADPSTLMSLVDAISTWWQSQPR